MDEQIDTHMRWIPTWYPQKPCLRRPNRRHTVGCSEVLRLEIHSPREKAHERPTLLTGFQSFAKFSRAKGKK